MGLNLQIYPISTRSGDNANVTDKAKDTDKDEDKEKHDKRERE